MIQHIFQAAVQTIDCVQIVCFIIILMGLQHNFLTLLRMDKIVICPFFIAQYNSGFINPCGKGFFDIFYTRTSSIDTPYNNATIPVSSSTNTEMLVRKPLFSRCFTVLSGVLGWLPGPLLRFLHIRLVCFNHALQ